MSKPNSTDGKSALVQALRKASPTSTTESDSYQECSKFLVTAYPTRGDEGGAVWAIRGSQGSELQRSRGTLVEESSKEKAHRMWKFLRSGMKQNMDEMIGLDNKPSVLIHGLQHLCHFPSVDPVLHMTYGEGAAGFVSLHRNGVVTFYHPDGRLRDAPCTSVPYAGLTSTRLPGRLAGWGPGSRLTLLDGELRLLADALDPLDVRVCQVTERSQELVTAGMGNVCVWCLTPMVCQVRVTEGFGHDSIFTQLALAPGGPERPHRAFVFYRNAVVVVNLTAGHVLEHRRNLHPRDITALAYSSSSDCVVTASKDVSIRVWGPDWSLQMAFVGHSGLVTSLVSCPESGLLLSASLDGTLRSWSLEEGDQVQCVLFQGVAPPVALGGPMKGATFYTFSQRGVDFWTSTSLYDLHCRLGGKLGGPVRQILVTPSQPPYPTRVLCVSGDSDITLVAAETGDVLTSFSAGRRVRCAEYCLTKEMALVLMEDGALIWASTLTNPATLVDELEGFGQRPWQREEQTDIEGDKGLAGPGPASCMVLYSNIADGQRALEDWKSLQDRRGQRPSNKKPLQDAKNRFLVMSGHDHGCVSVLRLDTGKLQYRTPAHHGQRIPSLEADPEHSYLLTAGEDKVVLVWKVFPYAQECLSLLLNIVCGQPPLRLALLGPLLALAFQEPATATYGLVHFNLLNQSRADHEPSDDHLDAITGLCVCPPLRVFASSSQDGTVRLWDEENCLLRTIHLSAEPECLAYSGERGDLLLGIRGDLYRIRSTHLPHDFHLQLCTEMSDTVPDQPISPTPTTKTKPVVSAMPEEQPQGKQDLNKDPVYEGLLARNRDLESLQEGTAERKKRKPPATPITRKEAFDRYMRMIYSPLFNIKVGDEDMFDLHAALFPPKLPELRPLTPPASREGFFPNSNLAKPLPPVTNPGQVGEPAPAQRNPMGFKPNSVLVGQLWPDVVVENTVPKKTFRLTFREPPCPEQEVADDTDDVKLLVHRIDEELDICPPVMLVGTPPEHESPPLPPPLPEKPAYAEKTPKPGTLPPTPPRTWTPSPPRTSTPEIPGFLRQFLEEDWFKGIYPDQRLIQGSLCPEEFSMQILEHMQACGDQPKLKMLDALLALRQQGELHDTKQLSKGLLVTLRKSISSNMTNDERRVVSEIVNVLVCVSPDSNEIIMTLLTLLAHKDLKLRSMVLCLLKEMGVKEADPWLVLQVDSWGSIARDQTDCWESLSEMAAEWLDCLTSKYQMQNRAIFLTETGNKNLFTCVDVLNYFCQERAESLNAPPIPQEGRKRTVLLLPKSLRSKPIQRLGETYTMSRIRRPPGVILPPLPNRPVLMGFTRFLTLPLPKVSPLPFRVHADQHRLEASPRRYFLLEQSYVNYYR